MEVGKDCISLISTVVAGIVAIRYLFKLLQGIHTFFFSRVLGLSKNLRKLGSWAVVTGATDGIGKAYALELASKGLNIVLISRNQEKLDDTEKEIKAKFTVEIKTIAVDFTSEDIYPQIKSQLESLDIACLVNNVGMGYPYPEYFCEIEDKLVTDMIKCNIVSVTQMSRIVLPGMVAKRKGVIINISSGSAATPTPLLSVYSATKAYVDFLSQSLHTEYESKGIIVQSVLPFFVTSKLSKIRRANLFVPNPTNYVRSALQTVGIQSRTFGYYVHAIQNSIYEMVPSCLFRKLALSQMKATRAAALRKKAKAQ